MNKYLDNGLYSQNGEYGIIKEILKRINLLQGHAIEFGAADGFFCSNTADISNEFQFSRNLYDICPTGMRVAFKEITPENVNEIGPCDLLSIDIDGNDYMVWKAYEGKPAVVVIEINSSLDPELEFFHPDRGASFRTMNELAFDKGYFLLAHTGNCVYVDAKYRDLFPETKNRNIYKCFNNSWLQQQA
jgi:hypothetical protein